jgi:hypothetical protein
MLWAGRFGRTGLDTTLRDFARELDQLPALPPHTKTTRMAKLEEFIRD